MTKNNTEEIEMIEVPKKAFLHTLFECAMEGEFDIHCPDECRDEFFDNFNPSTVQDVEVLDDETLNIMGSVIVREVVDYIPASGGARGEPPINPPEYIMEDVELGYSILYTMDGLGHCETYVETM